MKSTLRSQASLKERQIAEVPPWLPRHTNSVSFPAGEPSMAVARSSTTVRFSNSGMRIRCPLSRVGEEEPRTKAAKSLGSEL